MTPDERIEALLNRAGQTISDLPRSFAGGPEAYGEEARKNALCAAWSWYLPAVISAGDAVDLMQNRRNETVMAQYILHLTDIIDRMETALENVCGERDYLRHVARVEGCWTCTNSDSGMECHRPEGCVLNDEGRCVGYEYAGVPEDWWVDDED